MLLLLPNDLDQMKLFLSIGERYEELGCSEHATHHIVASFELSEEGIRVSCFDFEVKDINSSKIELSLIDDKQLLSNEDLLKQTDEFKGLSSKDVFESYDFIESDEEKREINNLKDMNVEIYDSRKYGRAHLIFLVERG